MKREMVDCTQLPSLRDCGKCKVKYCRTLGKGNAGMILEELEKDTPFDMTGLTARMKSEFPGVMGDK